MSYLEIPNNALPDFTKAVISVWFRVSMASLQACYDHYTDRISGGDAPASLWGILPLVTFGGPLTQPFLDSQRVELDGAERLPDLPYTLITFTTVTAEDVYLDPSVVGIDVSGLPSNSVAFVARFQSTATCKRDAYQVVSASWTHPGNIQSCSLLPVPTGPQSFNIRVVFDDVAGFVDKWHHAVISCDLSSGVSVQSTSDTEADCVISAAQLWVAIDDVNYTEGSAFEYWVDGGDPNDVITVDSMDVATKGAPPYSLPTANATGHFDIIDDMSVWNPDGFTPIAPSPDTGVRGETALTATVAARPIPANDYAFGIPSTSGLSDNIFKVEMAEFKMWVGKSIDTGNVDMRRLFVDENGKPVDPKVAEKALGKPSISLHKSSNWIKGKDTGSAGVDSDGKPKPSGQFTPVGTIKKFKPDPEIGKRTV